MKKILILLIAMTPLLYSFGSKSQEETASTPQYVKDYNAGVEAQKDNNYMDAITFYQRALDQKSDFPDAWNNLGYCYRMMAKSYLTKAGDAYGKALKYAPQHEEGIEYQGEYFIMVGQLKDAYKNYQKLKQMHSDETNDLKAKLDNILKQAQDILKDYSP